MVERWPCRRRGLDDSGGVHLLTDALSRSLYVVQGIAFEAVSISPETHRSAGDAENAC
jgi:hypothetical protein